MSMKGESDGVYPSTSATSRKCADPLMFSQTVLNILTLCKAEEGSDAVASLTDDNEADGRIDSAVGLNMSGSAHFVRFRFAPSHLGLSPHK